MTKKLAYILGFLWADGYLIHTKKTSKVVGMYLKYEDFNEIEDIIKDELKITTFYERYFNSKKRGKQRGFTSGKVKLYNFLYKLGYKDKSKISPIKVINYVGVEYFKYWLRGLIDGDGSIYCSSRTSQLSITSSYDYDWRDLIQIIKEEVGITHIGFF